MTEEKKMVAVYKASPLYAKAYCNGCEFSELVGAILYCQRKVFPKRLRKDRHVARLGSCGYWKDGIPF